MPSIAITRRFTFESAHHLPFHNGKCREPHGHSYKLEVTVRGAIDEVEHRVASNGVIEMSGNPQYGMVFDFAVLDAMVRNYVVGILDHHDINKLIGRGFEQIAITEGRRLAAQGIISYMGASDEWYWEHCGPRLKGVDGDKVPTLREVNGCPESTAENMSQWIWQRISQALTLERRRRGIRIREDLELTHIKLNETEDNWVELA